MELTAKMKRIKELHNKLVTGVGGKDERKLWHDELVGLRNSLPPSFDHQLKRMEHCLTWALNHTKELEVVLDNLEPGDNAMRNALDGITKELNEAMFILKGGDS